ncbi:LysR family transcriptional regulator [Duganella sp. FT50W]|uniref:LysR family transcriptional regulator n=1 Tax=Duganella lactea TaxID=2692173 RepID=A0A6L8MPX2_9BURK|nr:LysR substrate-binding domain-containing protein [Duganella lactea]MYM81798.1 LysR family transcriptional regulator [Duganella lactea]
MEDRFAGIREFVSVVDGGSLTSAAARLGVTGSAVGKSISRLETRLGVQLLHRTTRRMDLTTEGEAYLVSCRRVLEELAQTEAFLATGHQEPIGRLRVDLPTTFGRRHVMPTLVALGLRYEKLDLSVTLRDRAVDMVGEGIDLALRIGELGDLPDLVARRIGEQKTVICASQGYLERMGAPQSRADLQKHDCLVGWYRGTRPNWHLRDEHGAFQPFAFVPRHELTDGDALLCACVAGAGLAQLPTWLANEELEKGSIVSVLDNLSGMLAPIHLIWQKTRHLQPKVRVVVDELRSLADAQESIFRPSRGIRG